MTYFLTDNVIYANNHVLLEGGTSDATSGASEFNLVRYVNVVSGDDSYNSTTGIWTSPFTGRVRITAVAEIGGSRTTNFMSIKKNNSGTTSTGEVVRGEITSSVVSSVEGEITVVSGDQISLHRFHDGAASTLGTTAAFNRVSFTRVADYSAGQPIGFGVAEGEQYGLTRAPKVTVVPFTDTSYTPGNNATFCNQTFEPGTYILDCTVTVEPSALNTTGRMNIEISAGGQIIRDVYVDRFGDGVLHQVVDDRYVYHVSAHFTLETAGNVSVIWKNPGNGAGLFDPADSNVGDEGHRVFVTRIG